MGDLFPGIIPQFCQETTTSYGLWRPFDISYVPSAFGTVPKFQLFPPCLLSLLCTWSSKHEALSINALLFYPDFQVSVFLCVGASECYVFSTYVDLDNNIK